MNVRNHKTVKDRRTTLEKELSVNLKHIGTFSLDEGVASSRSCENMIGVAQVPMGIAGPLNIVTRREYYIPLATTEGALVASVNRGCKAITASGGAMVDSEKVGATRGPVFRVANIQESRMLFQFLEKHFDELARVAALTSHHLKLKTYTTTAVGRYRYVRFVFDTGDAMGLNMVTIASDAIASYIKEHTGISCLSLSGNFCVDKKPSWQNVVYGRGMKVWAEVTLTKNVLQDVLKTTAQKTYDVWLAKCMIGSAISGSMAFNAQFANIVAAIFLATGQDIAHVVEGSLGITAAEVVGDDLFVSVYMPDCMVGAVGGGTGLATQKEALSITGIQNAQELAEVVGATVLAGEISLLSSLEQGTLASAHKKFGRGESV